MEVASASRRTTRITQPADVVVAAVFQYVRPSELFAQ
jgi:hypothetical protein